MKNLVTLFILLSCTTFWAQEGVEINKNIQALKISAGIQVELITGSKTNRIEADKQVLDAINYKVRDYELKIGLPLGKIIDGDFPLKLKVYIKEIDRLTVVQGSTVELTKTLKSENFIIRATEGSVVSGSFNINSLELKVLSGAIVDIKGKSKKQDVLVNTGGQYEGENLKSEDTKVKVTYGGSAKVFVSQNCEARVVVGGTIDIYGNPKYVNEKTSFGGDINVNKE